MEADHRPWRPGASGPFRPDFPAVIEANDGATARARQRWAQVWSERRRDGERVYAAHPSDLGRAECLGR